MISIRSLFKTSLIYGFGSAIVRIMTFALVPLYTNASGAQGEVGWYGYYLLIFPVIGILRACYSHGAGDSFLKLYSQSEEKQEIVSTYIIHIILVTLGISSILFGCYLIMPIQPNNSLVGLLQTYFYYIILIVSFDTINSRLVDILRIKNYPLYYIIVHILGQLITILLAIYLVTKQGMGLKGALFALIGGSIITFIMFSPIVFKFLKITKFSIKYVKQLFNLGLRFFPATIFFLIMTQLDRFLLHSLLPESEPIVGAYGAATKLASIPMLVIGAFNLGWQPFFLSNGNNQSAIKKYEKIGTIFAILIISIAWIVAIIMPLIININIPSIGQVVNIANYPIPISIIPIIVVSHIFYALYIINMPPIYVCNKQNWSPIFRMCGATINLTLNIILIPHYQMLGAALATTISYGIMLILLLYKNKKWMPIQLVWQDIILLILICGISIFYFINQSNGQYYVLISTILYIGFLFYKHGIKNLIILFK